MWLFWGMIAVGELRALLATARVANVPSVVCNVWLGVAVTWVTAGHGHGALSTAALLLLSGAGVLLYVAGNFLNDWMDFGWDRVHRPERALPRGLFPRQGYLAVALVLAACGCCMAAWVSLYAAGVACSIVLAVVIYTYWHKRTPWAVLAMGSCRALLPVMGALGAGPFLAPPVLACAAGLFCYIAGLSLSARREALSPAPLSPGWPSRVLLAAPLALVSGAAAKTGIPWPWILCAGMLPYSSWVWLSLTRWRQPVPVHVSRLLAGIPWVDAIILLPLAFAGPLDPVTGAVPAVAFLAALALQRVAPAT